MFQPRKTLQMGLVPATCRGKHGKPPLNPLFYQCVIIVSILELYKIDILGCIPCTPFYVYYIRLKQSESRPYLDPPFVAPNGWKSQVIMRILLEIATFISGDSTQLEDSGPRAGPKGPKSRLSWLAVQEFLWNKIHRFIMVQHGSPWFTIQCLSSGWVKNL